MRFCWAQYLLWALIVLVGTSGMLTACGQKGPLFHPPAEEETREEQ